MPDGSFDPNAFSDAFDIGTAGDVVPGDKYIVIEIGPQYRLVEN
jgi:hypothetical protein